MRTLGYVHAWHYADWAGLPPASERALKALAVWVGSWRIQPKGDAAEKAIARDGMLQEARSALHEALAVSSNLHGDPYCLAVMALGKDVFRLMETSSRDRSTKSELRAAKKELEAALSNPPPLRLSSKT